MQDTDIPVKISTPWANGAVAPYVHQVPTPSQIGTTPGAASFTDGFPPLNFVLPGAGGVPPFGNDVNGVLQQVTQWIRWFQAGGSMPPWDSAFSTAVGGYPKGALVASAVTSGLYWESTADNNTTNPDTGGANWASFGLANSGVTPGTYTRPQLVIAGDGRVTAAVNGPFSTFTTLTIASVSPYAVQAGAKRLRIRMVGPGGAGATGSGAGGDGTAATSFNSVTANPGRGGTQHSGNTPGNGGLGGNTGSGTAVTRLPGGRGSDGGFGTGSSNGIGGIGGSSFFSGAGTPNAHPAEANSGSGGGGASGSIGAGGAAGDGGGGAGEYVEFVINNPVGPYAFVVGGKGTGGGANGGDGAIYIEEQYD